MTVQIIMCPDGVERAFALNHEDPLHPINLPEWHRESGCDVLEVHIFLNYQKQHGDVRKMTQRQFLSAVEQLAHTIKLSKKEMKAIIKRWRTYGPPDWRE